MNASGNLSMHEVGETAVWSTEFRIIRVTAFAILMLLITVGNGFLLYVIWHTRELKRSTRVFLASLTVADLCVGVIVIPLRFLPQLTQGGGLCKPYIFLEVFFICASTLSILALTVERYLAVEVPLRFRAIVTSRRACFAVGCIWILSACSALVCLSYSMAVLDEKLIVFDESLLVCLNSRVSGSALFVLLLVMVLYFVVPLCVTIIVSVRILIIVKRHTKFQEQAPDPRCVCPCNKASNTAIGKMHRVCSGTCHGLCKCFLLNKNALVTVLMVLSTYLASNVPYIASIFYIKLSADDIHATVFEVMKFLLFGSCFLNVAVYTIRNQTFRASAKRLLLKLLPMKCTQGRQAESRPKSSSESTSFNFDTAL